MSLGEVRFTSGRNKSLKVQMFGSFRIVGKQLCLYYQVWGKDFPVLFLIDTQIGKTSLVSKILNVYTVLPSSCFLFPLQIYFCLHQNTKLNKSIQFSLVIVHKENNTP